MIDIDPFLIDAVQRDTIPDFASPSDHFTTGGGLQFDFGDNPRRLRSGHVLISRVRRWNSTSTA
jgi:hypothetical protein